MTQNGFSDHILITSAANPAIKLMRSLGSRKSRQTERAFLVEGRRLAEEALRHRRSDVRLVLVREDIPESWWTQLGVDERRVRRVAAAVFDAASDVQHGQGIAVISDLPDPDIDPSVLAESGMVLILDRLRDPGNVGTALRSAAAAGVRTVLVTPGTADPFSPKVVRAGMGAHFRLRIGSLSENAAPFLRKRGSDVVYADASSPEDYHSYDWHRAAALVVGGETESLSPELDALVTQGVRIPMRGSMESLNAGVAASVLLFEAQRQGALDR